MKVLRLLSVVILLLIAHSTYATQVLGGHISWQCLGGNQYQITFVQYKDCFGATPAMPTENVSLFPTGCGALPFSLILTFQSQTEISELCPSELANSTCVNYFNPLDPGGLIPGVVRVVYSGVATLDPGCTYKIVWNENNWNYFSNINSSTQPDAYIYSTINTASCTSSPTITSTGAPYECANNGTLTNPITLGNIGGNSVAYSLVTPQTTSGSAAFNTDVPGYVALPGLAINPTTGALSFNSAGVTPGFYVVGIQMTITNGGNPVGTIYENMTVVIRDCTSTPTTFSNPDVQSIDFGISEGPAIIGVCVGDSLKFSVVASNTNPTRGITLSEVHPAILNSGNPVFSQVGINPATGTFAMLTSTAMVGTHVITFNAIDDACNLPGTDQIQVTVNIYPSITVSVTDTMVCLGQPVPITASGGASFTWSVLTGDTSPGFDGNSANQILESISTDTEVQVTLNGVPPQCNATEVIDIDIALQSVNLAVTDETCVQNDGAIDLSVVGGTGTYTYLWSHGPITQDVTGLDGIQYCVTVTDQGVAGCSTNVCATVGTTPPPGGSINIGGTAAATICAGSAATISFNLTGPGPWVVNGTGAGIAWPLTVAAMPFSVNVNPVVNTTYTLTSVAYQNFPACVTTVNSPVAVTVRPLVTGTFAQAGPICSGSSTPLTVNISQPGNFNVTWAANPADPASAPNLPANPWSNGQVLNGVNPTATTVYSITDVQYTTAPFCPNPQNNQMTVTVNALPTVTLTGATTICLGGNTNLTATLTGQAPWSLNGTGAGTTWPINGINTSPRIINVTPAATTNYCITNITDGNGCSATVNVCQTVTVTTNATPTVSVVATTGTTICAGTSVTFTATPTNGGATPTYQWFINPGNIAVGGNSPTFTTTGLTNGQSVSVTMTSSLACVTTPTASSAPIVFTVNPVVVPSVNITANPAGAICAGTSVTFTAAPNNGGMAPTYQWISSVSGPIPGATGSTFTSTTLVNGTGISVQMSSSAACPSVASVTSNVINMVVNPILVPSVTIAANPTGTICQGTNVTFTATPVNPGAAPTYQWTVNGVNVGTGATYSSTGLNDNDIVRVSLTSNALCANPTNVLSNQITMDVLPLVTPSVTIAASPVGPLCAGQNATFTATPVNGGAAPTYTWFVNNVAQAGFTGNTYTVNAPVNNTQVSVTLNSNAQCTTTATANSLASTITVNPLPTAVFASGGSICQGQSFNSQINVTGTGNITLQIFSTANATVPIATTTGTAPTINFNLNAAGNYYIGTTTDQNCVNSADSPTVNLVVNSLPTAAISANAAICAGQTHNFNLTFTGAAPFTYSVQTPAGTVNPPASATTTTTFNAVSANPGNYSITTVTDNNGCTSAAGSSVSTLTVNPLPTALLDGDATICAGQSHDFDIAFTGTLPFNYVLNTPTNPTLAIVHNGPGNIDLFTATAAGNYSVTSVTDGNGCISATASPVNVLTVNPLPTATFSADATVCSNDCHDFTIALTGTGPWDFDVTTPSGPDAGNTHTSPTANYTYQACEEGNFFVTTITDATGCINNTDSPIAAVDWIPLPTASWAVTDTSFCSNSSIDLLVDLTGTGPFDITVNGGTVWNSLTPQYAETINLPGTFCIDEVMDATGCSSVINECIDVLEINLPLVDAGADLSVCIGLPILLGTLAQPGQEYLWDAPAGMLADDTNAQAVATYNIPGTYTLTLTAFNQYCPLSDQMDLTVNALPTVTVAADDDVICFNGSSILTASGALNYAWTLSPSLTGLFTDNPITVNPLVTEVFEVTGEDANGCINTATIEIVVGTELIVTETFPADICFGACDGTIELVPSGSFGNYVLNWTTPLPDLDDYIEAELCAGTYTYSVSDIENCVYDGSITINSLPQNYIEDVIILQPACFGEATGSITVIDDLAVEYNITGPEIETNTTGIFNNVPAGAYNILVTDNLGCLGDTLVTFNSINPEIVLNPVAFPTPFCYEAIVPFSTTVTGGSGNFNVFWNSCPEATGCLEGVNSPFNFIITQDTTLYVYAEDLGAPGCYSDTLGVFAFLNPPIEVSILNGDLEEICQNTCIDLSATVSGGSNTLTTAWFEVPNPISSTPLANGTAFTACPLSTTQYFIYAADGCNPPASDTISITVFPVPVVSFTVDTLQGCFPVLVNFDNTTEPAALIQDCQWNFGDGNTLSNCGIGSFPYLYSDLGPFTPSLQITTVDDCIVSDTLDTPITVYGFPEIDFTYTPEVVNTLENTVEFTNLTVAGDYFEWRFSTFDVSTEFEPIYTFPDIDDAIYDVCLISGNDFGCIDTLCRPIVIESVFQVFVPNAFTPDQDGRNEVFLPKIQGVEEGTFQMWIYDRWGTQVFYTNDPKIGWTGNVNGGEYYVHTNVFTWRIEAKRMSNSKFEVLEGTILMLR